MQTTRLCTQQEALHQYLDSLLAEIPPLEPEQAARPETAPPPSERAAPDTAPAHPPPWAQYPFKVLMFELGGLRLAAPVHLLDGVAPGQRLTRLPGLPAWCQGVLLHHGRKVLVVDTAAVVEGASPRDDGAEAGHYVLLAEGRYALACDAVLEIREIDPQTVRWRRGAGRRPWYGGILRDSLCALLDVDALCAMLAPDDTG